MPSQRWQYSQVYNCSYCEVLTAQPRSTAISRPFTMPSQEVLLSQGRSQCPAKKYCYLKAVHNAQPRSTAIWRPFTMPSQEVLLSEGHSQCPAKKYCYLKAVHNAQPRSTAIWRPFTMPSQEVLLSEGCSQCPAKKYCYLKAVHKSQNPFSSTAPKQVPYRAESQALGAGSWMSLLYCLFILHDRSFHLHTVSN